VHVIHYEELHEKPKETLQELCRFLGKNLDDKKLEAVISWCSFENMKSNPAVNYDWYKEIGLFRKDGNFFRKGKIGDWLNHFDLDLSKQFDQAVEKNLVYKAKNIDFGISDADLDKIYSIGSKKNNN
jgi:hypothetical protein